MGNPQTVKWIINHLFYNVAQSDIVMIYHISIMLLFEKVYKFFPIWYWYFFIWFFLSSNKHYQERKAFYWEGKPIWLFSGKLNVKKYKIKFWWRFSSNFMMSVIFIVSQVQVICSHILIAICNLYISFARTYRSPILPILSVLCFKKK